jgi:hypothetical protein
LEEMKETTEKDDEYADELEEPYSTTQFEVVG